ncbi:MAG: hypothetical protein QXR45_08360 [Candidatus Bathyarchaeia archaeon]
METIKPDQLPLAVVLGLSPTGLFVARSLGRKGIPVLGIDKDSWSVGRFSKYVNFIHEKSEEFLYKALLGIASFGKHKPILFCADDYHLCFLSNYAETLSKYYIIPDSYNKTTIEIFLDKEKFYKMCMDQGIDLPQTFFPSDLSEVESISRKIHYPCVIKPRVPHLWRRILKGKKMVEVNNPKELVNQYKALSSISRDLIIQEVVLGGDELIYIFGGYFNRSHRPLAIFTGRKLRQFPPRFGSASLVESLWHHQIAEKSINILKKARFHGICGTEFKLDPRTNTFKMMEINIRPTLWFSVTEASGVDIIYTAYKDLAGFTATKNLIIQNKYGKWIYFVRDFVSSLYYIMHGELGVKDWIGSLKGVNAHAVYAGDDISPAVIQPFSIFREFIDYFLKGGWAA